MLRGNAEYAKSFSELVQSNNEIGWFFGLLGPTGFSN
jgi:hypothetical protein